MAFRHFDERVAKDDSYDLCLYVVVIAFWDHTFLVLRSSFCIERWSLW